MATSRPVKSEPTVETPLPHVAVHPTNPERMVLRFFIHVVRATIGVFTEPANFRQGGGAVARVVLSVSVCGESATATRVFPFRFGRHTYFTNVSRQTLPIEQPVAERHGIVPTDLLYRATWSLEMTWIKVVKF